MRKNGRNKNSFHEYVHLERKKEETMLYLSGILNFSTEGETILNQSIITTIQISLFHIIILFFRQY